MDAGIVIQAVRDMYSEIAARIAIDTAMKTAFGALSSADEAVARA